MSWKRWILTLCICAGGILVSVGCRCRVGNYAQERAWNLLEQPQSRVQQLNFYNRRYAVELRERYIVAEGDIIIGEVGPENVSKFGEIAAPTQDTILSLGRVRRTGGSYVWSNGQVPFLFDEALSQNQRRVILEAMGIWAGRVALKFKTRTGENDFIFFRAGESGSGCFSDLGRIGGRQIVSLESGCFDAGAIAHVIGHALGFEHEHNRADRDNYIQVHELRIETALRPRFRKRRTNGLHIAGYDPGSLMHFSDRAFAAGDEAVFSLKSAKGKTAANRRSTLSGGDYTSAAAYYGNAWYTMAADVSGDRRTDLIDVRKGRGEAGVWSSTEEGFRERDSFGPAEAVAGNYQRSLYLTGDFNGDGKTDLIEINRSKRVAYVWKGNSSAFSDKNSFGLIKGLAEQADLAHYVTGDFNGDENDDLIEINRRKRSTRLWYSRGVEFEKSQGNPANGVARVFSNAFYFANDFNGDGHDDLMEVNRSYGFVYVWLGGNRGLYYRGNYGGAGGISREQIGVSYLIGDFEGDERADLMEVNRSLGRGRVWSGGRGGMADYFRSAAELAPPERSAVHLLADTNGDGGDDLIEIDRESGELRVWLADRGFFQQPGAYGPGRGAAGRDIPARYFSGDFNGDKREDVLELNIAESRAYLWPARENEFGTRVLWAEID